ncbi:MAG: LapA family protein [candidate division WOR-3 bacterium]
MVVFRVVLVLVVFVVLLVLALMNVEEPVRVWLFGQTYEQVPLALVMLYSFAFGAVCVGIFTIVTEVQLRARLRNARRETEALLEELSAFRNAPLEPSPVTKEQEE